MQLPVELRDAIAKLAEKSDARAVARAAEAISNRYRGREFGTPVLRTDADRIAYALTRTPATYAANVRVLREVRRLVGDLQIESVLDLGAGTGAASWAAVEVFPGIKRLSLVDQDSKLIEMGREFATHAPHAALRESSTWFHGYINSHFLSAADLVILSYSLGELSRENADSIIGAAQRTASKLLVIVEPGTVKGFENVLRARTYLIEQGAELVAPCPHHKPCPMVEAGDWCHFAQRVDRTSSHRRLKGAELGYEDEKFSYVVASVWKSPVSRAKSRIVRHPLVRGGHVQLTLCTDSGLQRETIGKSQKDKFRIARKAEWGDPWE